MSAQIEAGVLIRLEAGKERAAIDAIKGIEGVRRVDGVAGRFDAVAMVVVPDLATLTGVVIDKIRKVDGVLYTETLVKII